jgi:hypothetical protein
MTSAQGQQRTSRAEIAMSALPPKADIRPRDQDVRFGPKADIGAPKADSRLHAKPTLRPLSSCC